MTHITRTIDGHTVTVTGPDAEGLMRMLFTPLTDEQERKFLRDECIYISEDICGWSFGQGVKWAEKMHGITGETK